MKEYHCLEINAGIKSVSTVVTIEYYSMATKAVAGITTGAVIIISTSFTIFTFVTLITTMFIALTVFITTIIINGFSQAQHYLIIYSQTILGAPSALYLLAPVFSSTNYYQPEGVVSLQKQIHYYY